MMMMHPTLQMSRKVCSTLAIRLDLSGMFGARHNLVQ